MPPVCGSSSTARVITARVEPAATRASRKARKQLLGHRVEFVCGTSSRDGAGTITHRARNWPADRLAVRIRLPHDISRSVDWCLIESVRDGGDIAVADMKP